MPKHTMYQALLPLFLPRNKTTNALYMYMYIYLWRKDEEKTHVHVHVALRVRFTTYGRHLELECCNIFLQTCIDFNCSGNGTMLSQLTIP